MNPEPIQRLVREATLSHARNRCFEEGCPLCDAIRDVATLLAVSKLFESSEVPPFDGRVLTIPEGGNVDAVCAESFSIRLCVRCEARLSPIATADVRTCSRCSNLP